MAKLTIDDILVETEGFGRSQWIIQFFINVPMVIASWSMLQMTFLGKVPDWECTSNVTQNITDTDWNYTRFKQCYLDQTPCGQFHFDNSVMTIVNQWSLVCDLSWVTATTISIQMAGVLLGSVSSGHLSDQFGRKRTLFAFLLWHGAFNLAVALSGWWQMFAVLRFFIGIGIGGILAVVFPYSLEFLPPNQRTVMAVLPIWSCGVLVLTAAAYVLPHWAYVHIACGVVSLIVLFGWIYLPESIRWLAVHERQEEAIVIIERLSMRNNKVAPLSTRNIIESVAREKQDTDGNKQMYSYLDLFSTCYLTRVSIIVCYFWFVLSLVNYGVSFAVSSFSGDIYINVAVMTLLDIPALPPTFWLMNRFGRRWSVIALFSISTACAGCCILVIFLGPDESQLTIVKWLSILCKVSVNAAWDAVQTWQIELYPTVIRNLGYGASNTAARLGGIAAPFVVNLDRMLMTYSITTCVTFLCVALSFTLPETLDRPLQDNMFPATEAKQEDVTIMTSSHIVDWKDSWEGNGDRTPANQRGEVYTS